MNQIAGYTVVSRLGSGARSTIYAVRDDEGHMFALKHVMRKGPNDDRFIEQAETEHEVASSLDHPNLRKSIKVIRQRSIIRIREIYVLMEYVDGEVLSEMKNIPVHRLCELFIEVARGLGALHAAGYIHADIKPNNMVIHSGGVKIIDFGQSCKNGTVKPRVQGTPDYIAPEQVLKLQITPRTDIFNLGASLYHTLTGRPIPTLVPKSTVGALAMENKIVSPEEINKDVPPALSSLIKACIQQEPSSRPPNMDAVITRLEIAHRQSLDRQSA